MKDTIVRVRIRFTGKILGGQRGIDPDEPTHFLRDDTGIYLEDRIIYAMLKSTAEKYIRAGNYLGFDSASDLRGVIRDLVYVEPPRIYLERDGRILQRQDGVVELPVQQWARGRPVTALSRRQYVERAECEFRIGVMGGVLSSEQLKQLLTYAGKVTGLGAAHRAGFGRFEIIDFEVIQEGEVEVKAVKKRKRGR